MILGEAERCEIISPSADNFDSYRFLRPVVFTNFVAAHGWSAVEKWKDMKFLHGILDSTITPVHAVDADAAFDPSQSSSQTVNMPWTEALDKVFAAREMLDAQRFYIKSGMDHRFLSDIQPFPDETFGLHGKERIQNSLAKVWIGSRGNVTPLHFDLSHACLIQIFGTKEVILFPPQASRSLYPFASTSGPPRVSRLNLTALLRGCEVTSKEFPLAHGAHGGLRCNLGPGEALYIPPFWWHHVTALEHNISVLTPFDLSPLEQRKAERPWVSPEWGVYAS